MKHDKLTVENADTLTVPGDILRHVRSLSVEDNSRKLFFSGQTTSTLYTLSDYLDIKWQAAVTQWRDSIDSVVAYIQTVIPNLYTRFVEKKLLIVSDQNEYEADFQRERILNLLGTIYRLIEEKISEAQILWDHDSVYIEYKCMLEYLQTNVDEASALSLTIDRAVSAREQISFLRTLSSSVFHEIDNRAQSARNAVENEVQHVCDGTISLDLFVKKLSQETVDYLRKVACGEQRTDETQSFSERQLIWIRAASVLPEMSGTDGFLDSKRGGSNKTIHGSLNHPVASHPYGSWGHHAVWIFAPLKELVEYNTPPLSLNHIDTYWYDQSLRLPPNTILLQGIDNQKKDSLSKRGTMTIITYPRTDFDYRYRLLYASIILLGFTPLFGGMHPNPTIQKGLLPLIELWHSCPLQHCDVSLEQLEKMKNEQRTSLLKI